MLYWYAVMLFLYKKYKHALLGRIPLFLETGRRPRNIIVNLNVTVIASKRDIASPMCLLIRKKGFTVSNLLSKSTIFSWVKLNLGTKLPDNTRRSFINPFWTSLTSYC